MSLNTDQLNGLYILKNGENAFITGDAGTGKSYLISEFIDWAEGEGKRVVVTAPTGIAAINIDGATLHRTFNIPLEPLVNGIGKIPGDMRGIDILIIDEISMCRIDMFDYVARCILKINEWRTSRLNLPEVQVVVIGDFFQLPPVIPPKDREVLEAYYPRLNKGFAFQSDYWDILNFHNIILRESMRQKEDFDFVYNLNKLRVGDTSCLNYFHSESSTNSLSDAIMLCGTNKRVQEENEKGLSILDTPEYTYKLVQSGEVKPSDKSVDDVLKLKVGARVMTVINDPDNHYQNGSLGTVTDLTKMAVTVKLDNGHVVTLLKHTWEVKKYHIVNAKVEKEVIGKFSQIPLKLAYAITIHKSQGQTYDSVNIDPYCWDVGQLYVAISRVTKVSNMHLIQRIQVPWVKCSEEVKRFYNS